MASITNEGNGRRRVQFMLDGQRKGIRLGACSERLAERFADRVEDLITSRSLSATPARETAEWLKELDEDVHAKLAALGLVSSRTTTATLALGAFIDGYIADRTDAKPRTIINLKQTRTDLVKFFGEDRALSTITKGDADEFWRWLIRPAAGSGNMMQPAGRGLNANTAKRLCGRAKQLFQVAIDKGHVGANPFKHMKCRVRGSDEAREFFVTRDVALKVLDKCPDVQWKLIFALSRFGGLRCPSETLSLKWEDIHWDEDRITVHCPKLEHLDGKATRQIPLFPELRPILDEALAETNYEAGPGAHLITRYRDCNANLRTGLNRILKRAGVKPWPKLFHNLRASRQTELCKQWPAHVVCEWIGNSAAIAAEHYLQVTDADFTTAAALPQISAEPAGGAPLVQNAVQPAHATQRQTTTPASTDAVCRTVAAGVVPGRAGGYPQGGQNYPADSIGNHEVGGGVVQNPVQPDPDLAEVVERWPDLTADVRAGVMRLVRGA